MKVVRPIAVPIPGERVLALRPPLAPYVTNAPRSRMAPFTGRALTETMLTSEQTGKAADVARIARAVAPGVVEGLEVGIAGAALQILPGRALALGGEDVELHGALTLAVDAIPIDGAGLADRLPDGDPLRARLADGDTLTLADIRAADRLDLLPHALVLTAVPVSIAIDRTAEDDDPCENATGEAVASDLAWEDGFQLVWVPWPADRLLPAWSEDGTTLSARFRNRLAYAIFNAEAAGEPVWPWALRGVPLSIVGFDAAFAAVFADRGAVVRQGGGRRNRMPLVGKEGDDALWQARVAQALEHLAELPAAERTAERLAAQFDWLPPAAILPRDAADFDAGRQFVLPASFDVSALPIPIDMVDTLVSESSRLAPINLSLPDAVQMLVPVPAARFDPDLLDLAPALNPLFDSEVLRLTTTHADLLADRADSRQRYDLLSRGMSGRIPGWALEDGDALPDEVGTRAILRPHRGNAAAGASEAHGFSGAIGTLALAPADTLFVWVRMDAAPASLMLRATVRDGAVPPIGWGDGLGDAVSGGSLPAPGRWTRLDVPVAAGAGGKVVTGLTFTVTAGAEAAAMLWGPVGRIGADEATWFDGILPAGAVASGSWDWVGDVPADATDMTFADNQAHLTELDTLVATYTAFNNGILKGELGEGQGSTNPHLADAGLDELIARLNQRIAAADDHVEFGFLRARTDIYRIRQSVLGVEDAGRILTAPSAAELIKRNDTPVATDREFDDYFKAAAGKLLVTSGQLESMTDGATEATGVSLGGFSIGRTLSSGTSSSVGLSNAALSLAASRIGAGTTASDTAVFSDRSSGGLFVNTGPGASGGILIGDFGAVSGPAIRPGVGVTVGIGDTKIDAPAATIDTQVVASVLGGTNFGTSVVGRLRTEPTIDDVAGSSLFGATVNSVTVGERLTSPAAVVAKNAAAKGKNDFVINGAELLAKSGLAIDDLPVFGFKPRTGTDAVTAGGLRANPAAFDDTDTAEPDDQHESAYFARGLDAVDNMIRFLRGVEVRAEDYRRLQTDATAARTRMLASRTTISATLDRIASDLSATRHDLAVARSLRAEEVSRLDALVATRRQILAEEVPFLLIRRPLVTASAIDVPKLVAESGLADDPVPACRDDHGNLPADLQAMIDTLRDVPARWLRRIHPLIDQFDRLDLLQNLVSSSGNRLATTAVQITSAAASAAPGNATTPLVTAFARQASRLVSARQTAIRVQGTAQPNSWREAATFAKSVVSISDLLIGPLRPVTLAAAGEMDDIAGVAGCLYTAFSGTSAALRLRWAEAFSQYDDPPSLRLLSALPGFETIDFDERRRMQALVDWLYSRIEPDADALGAIDDLVRVAMLVAAHAPVRKIVAARIRRPVPNLIDTRLELAIDPSLIRIGMQVQVHTSATPDRPAARAIIDDLTADGALARIVDVDRSVSAIDADARVILGTGLSFTTPLTAARDNTRNMAAAASAVAVNARMRNLPGR